MGLGRILVAADGSPHGDHALDLGKRLAALTGATLAAVFVTEPGSVGGGRIVDFERPADDALSVFRREGLAGVEIVRCAEQWRADLVVLGRNGHLSPGLGTTTETVLRRRHGPTLLVPRRVEGLSRILYAIDGSERGLRVLDRGAQFSAVTGSTSTALCVLPPDAMGQVPGSGWSHPSFSRALGAMARRPDLGGAESLAMRWGEPVSEVLRHVADSAADVVVLGLRQGGPGGDPGSGHIARDLLLAVPVAILAVPI